MDFKLKVVANAAAIQTKREQGPDNVVKLIEVKISRIIARGDEIQMQLAMDYETAKKYDLGSEMIVTVQ